MIRSCRGNCRLARADALDEQVGIHNRRMSADDRSESSKALIEGGRPHIHQDTGRIHDLLEFLRCHRRNLLTAANGDQIVSHAAARKRVEESRLLS